MPARTRASRYACGRAQYAWKKAVLAVGRHPHRHDSLRAEMGRDRLDRHPGEALEARQIVAHQPEAICEGGIPSEQHRASARDAPQLPQPARAIAPVVVGQHGERCVEAGVLERQRLRLRPHDRRRVGRSLRDHRLRRLDRDRSHAARACVSRSAALAPRPHVQIRISLLCPR